MLESYRNAGILWESYYPTGIHETRLSNAKWMGNTTMYARSELDPNIRYSTFFVVASRLSNWTFCVTLSVMALVSAELLLNDMLSWPRGGVLELRSSMGRSEHVR